MNQQKRNRQSYVLSENGWKKFQNALEEKFEGKCSNERLAGLSALSTDTISTIRRRKKRVDESSIETLFLALGLQLEENDLSVTVQVSPPKLDPNFVGRESAIADLNKLIEQGAKAIVIYGKGGIGKTTLAWQFLNTLGFDKILDLQMAKEAQTITNAESVIEGWLGKHFNEQRGQEFGITLDKLRQHLRKPNPRIGILIDNLEPALDAKGRCIEAHRNYVELFSALSDRAVQSVTLITSRERLCESSVTVEHYRLEGLDVAAWEEFFNCRNIQTDTEVLNAMHQAYGGNAKAMEIFRSAIKEYNNSLAAYWQANKDDLLIEPDLEHLVVTQFNRLQQLDSSAYKLLCRLGCYRYQDVPRVPENGLSCLLWDVADSQHRRVIKSLRDRSLVEFENGQYWLHPVIREEAIKRLRESEDWEIANRKAAEFWTESVKTVETVEDALRAFEAYYQYLAINEIELAGEVLIKERENKWATNSPLGVSFYRLGFLRNLSDSIDKIITGIKGEYTLCRLCNILGDSYWLRGNIHEAIKCHERSKQMAIEFQKKISNTSNMTDLKIKLRRCEISGLLNIGLCKVDLWEIEEAISLFETVSTFTETNDYSSEPIKNSWFYLAFLNSCLRLEKKSRDYLDESEKLKNQIKPQTEWGIGNRLLILGMTYKNLGEYKKSLERYLQAISYAQESNYIQVEAKALYGLAELYREQGNFTTVLSHHTEAIELLEKIGAKCDLAEAYYQLALTYQKMGDTEKSQPKFQQAIRLFTEMEAPKQVEKVQRAMENG